ncbi:MAG: hypothetical protein V3T82_07935 [Nitrospinaceae bacterium]
MAVTTESAIQVARLLAGAIKNLTTDILGRMRKIRFDFTQGAAAGDANSTMTLAIIPAGASRLYLRESLIAFSAFGAGRTLDIGHSAFTDRDGDAVAADPDAFVDGLDVELAGTSALTGVVGGEESILFDTQTEFTIFATVLGATIPAAATLNGDITIVRD